MNTKGYTLLFTVLISGIILAITLGISRISYNEAVLSSVARDGGVAFFAADTGFECAIFNDLESNVFFGDPTTQSFSCLDIEFNTLPKISAPPGASQYGDRYNFFIDLPNGFCSEVNVYKEYVPLGSPSSYTRVESFGYNKNCDVTKSTMYPDTYGPDLYDPNLVQRALGATYRNDLQLSGGSTSSPSGLGSQFPADATATQSSQNPGNNNGGTSPTNVDGQIIQNLTQPGSGNPNVGGGGLSPFGNVPTIQNQNN